MCEKCNNKKSFGNNPFTKIITGFSPPVELISISDYASEHGKVPSQNELTQYTLSSKAKASSASKDRNGCHNQLDVLQVRKDALLKELEMINAAIDNEVSEKLFDQLVADATAELDIFITALEDKYNEDIVACAAEKILAFPVDAIDTWINKLHLVFGDK